MSSQKRPQKIQAQKLIGQIVHRNKGSLSDKESIIYSLGIGFSQNPLKQQDFKFTSDVSQDFMAFPTVAGVSHKTNFITSLMESPYMPIFNPFAILHAQQKITMIKDKLQIGVQYEHEARITDVVDKGKNAIIWYEVNSYLDNDGKKQLSHICNLGIFIRGLGGFGFKGKHSYPPPAQIPKRKPDLVCKVITFPSQAFLYRLTGDRNALHIDPKVAQSQNFTRPIIHGMATYGSVARVFVQQILNNDPSRFKSYQARFIGHVFPGQILLLSFWKEGQLYYVYEAETQERKTKVMVGTFEIKPESKL